MAWARAGRPSAADAQLGVGCRAWRTTRGRLFSFGNERAAALGVPRAGAPPGEGRGARRVQSRPSGSGDRCAMWHTSREDRYPLGVRRRSEEHTSELQSLMRISYAVFCLNKITSQTRIMKSM